MKQYPSESPRKWVNIGLTVPAEKSPDHTRLMIGIHKQMTVQRAIYLYLRSLRQRKLSPTYVKQSRSVLSAIKKRFGTALTRDLEEKHIKRVLRSLYNKVAPNTYAHYSRVFFHFFEFCRAKKYVLYNYVREFDHPYHRAKMFFSTTQLDIIFKSLEPGELRDACLIIYHTGIKRSELDEIVRADFTNDLLILKHRRVNCPYHVLKVIERRRLYDSARVERNFREFMSALEFEGNLRFLQNAFVLRLHYAGTPIRVIRHQLGFERDKDVEHKIARLTSGAKSLYEFATKNPFKDYY